MILDVGAAAASGSAGPVGADDASLLYYREYCLATKNPGSNVIHFLSAAKVPKLAFVLAVTRTRSSGHDLVPSLLLQHCLKDTNVHPH
jgi:hypothetical protein